MYNAPKRYPAKLENTTLMANRILVISLKSCHAEILAVFVFAKLKEAVFTSLKKWCKDTA